MARITFVDELPPERRGAGPRRPRVWGRGIATQLRKQPGRWAHVDTQRTEGKAIGRATAIRGGTSPFKPAGSFQVTQRRQPSGEYHLYARYVGPNGEHAEGDTE